MNLIPIPDGNTAYFDIVASELQGGRLCPYLFIICLDYEAKDKLHKLLRTRTMPNT